MDERERDIRKAGRLRIVGVAMGVAGVLSLVLALILNGLPILDLWPFLTAVAGFALLVSGPRILLYNRTVRKAATLVGSDRLRTLGLRSVPFDATPETLAKVFLEAGFADTGSAVQRVVDSPLYQHLVETVKIVETTDPKSQLDGFADVVDDVFARIVRRPDRPFWERNILYFVMFMDGVDSAHGDGVAAFARSQILRQIASPGYSNTIVPILYDRQTRRLHYFDDGEPKSLRTYAIGLRHFLETVFGSAS